MSKHTIYVEWEHEGREIPVNLTFEYRPGRKGVRTLRNGDPGYPDDPDELEAVAFQTWENKLSSAELVALTEWANDYLNDEGYDDAVDWAVKDLEAEADDAADARRESRREES
jgi:hypothetical protein